MGEKKGNLTENESLLSCPTTGCFGEQQITPTSNFKQFMAEIPLFSPIPTTPRTTTPQEQGQHPPSLQPLGWDEGLSAKLVAEDKDSHVCLPKPVSSY